MKHLFIINPKSFRDERRIVAFKTEIRRYFDDESDYHIHISRYPRDAVGIVRKYAASHDCAVRVYAVGGDGILFDCLNGIVGLPDAELAAIPYGSTNDFARAVSGGDLSRLQKIEPLLTAPSVSTDIMQSGNNCAINFCSVGVESAATIKWYNLQTKYIKTKRSWVVNSIVTLSGLLAALNKKLVNQYYSIEIDGHKYDGHYAVINCSNGPYYGGNKTVVPEAIVDDGLINVLLMKSISRIKLLSIIPWYLKGYYTKYPDIITHIKAQEVIIRSEQPLSINMDGECFLNSTLRLRIMPSAVQIIAAGGPSYRGERGNE